MSGCVSFHFLKLKHKKTQCVLHCAAFILHNYNFHKTLHALIFSRLFKKTNYIHLFSPQITSFMFAAFLNLPNAQKDSFSQCCESLICRWWKRSVFVFPLFWTLNVTLTANKHYRSLFYQGPFGINSSGESLRCGCHYFVAQSTLPQMSGQYIW